MESKSPSLCRLCNISLASPSAWRQHAKSDWQFVAHPHTNSDADGMLTASASVYNLRVKVAQPGAIISPPSSSPRRQRSAASSHSNESHEDVDDESDYYSEDEDSEPAAGFQFNAHQCLFCNTESGSFDDNLQHMSRTHSFTVPYREHLIVDAETIAAYLHLVIYGYRECIQCGCRRRSVEGIHHHMTAKGHCRFDIVSDMEEFYHMPSRNYTADADCLRLPSGKLLSNPSKPTGPSVSRTPRSSTRRRMALTTLPNSSHRAPGAELFSQDASDAPPSSHTQLSRMARGDQQSLAHLRDYQVRSLVTTGARAVEGARREAKHSDLKLSKAGNVTLMGTFRADTSKRFRGPWG